MKCVLQPSFSGSYINRQFPPRCFRSLLPSLSTPLSSFSSFAAIFPFRTPFNLSGFLRAFLRPASVVFPLARPMPPSHVAFSSSSSGRFFYASQRVACYIFRLLISPLVSSGFLFAAPSRPGSYSPLTIGIS